MHQLCTITDQYRGGGWGINTPDSAEMVAAFARMEGIFIENVYTSKVLVSMEDWVRTGKATGAVCYLHTGGFGSLFSQTRSKKTRRNRYGIWILTLLPPIIAIVAAVAFRKVALALLIGIFSGEMILFGWNPFLALDATVNEILNVCSDTGNLKTFLFTALMGAFVIMVEVSGGVDGFVNYLTVQSRKVKSKRAAMLIAYGIGILIFIDGLLSIMFTGVVTRPLIDKYKVSREKLAYICDATSAR